MVVVNFLGGPGSGKSTFSSSVFSELKWRGINCEIVTEYAKDKVWEGAYNAIENQLHVLGRQSYRQYRLNGKVDVILTDSPILISLLYAKYDRHATTEFKKVAIDEFKSYNNVNFFINRNNHYQPEGRMQTIEEAKIIDNSILEILDDNNIEYDTIPYGKNEIPSIVDKIINILNA